MGVGVLGLIVEEVNDEGLLFNEYCNKYIFRALGMNNTHWHLKEIPNY